MTILRAAQLGVISSFREFSLDETHQVSPGPPQRLCQFQDGCERWLLLTELKNTYVSAPQIGFETQLLLGKSRLKA